MKLLKLKHTFRRIPAHREVNVRTYHGPAPVVVAAPSPLAKVMMSTRCLRQNGRLRRGVCLASGACISWMGSTILTTKRQIHCHKLDRRRELPEATAEFVHPYHAKPWYWKALFYIRRGVFLFSVWLPVALVGMAAAVTNSRRLKSVAIRYMRWTLELRANPNPNQVHAVDPGVVRHDFPQVWAVDVHEARHVLPRDDQGQGQHQG